MNFDEAAAFARNWIDDWNRADLDAVLAHYADNVTFRSPYVSKVLAGKTAVVGKEELREYWSAGSRFRRPEDDVLYRHVASTVRTADDGGACSQ